MATGLAIGVNFNGADPGLGFSPPVAGFKLWNNFYGASQPDANAKAIRNQILGGATGLLSGVPVFTADHISWIGGTGLVYMTSGVGINDSKECTIYIACRWPAPTAATLNYAFADGVSPAQLSGTRTTNGVNLYFNSSANQIGSQRGQFTGSTNTSSVVSFTAGADFHANWALYEIVVGDTIHTVTDYTNNIAASVAVTLPRDYSSTPIRIGGGYVGAVAKSDTAFFGMIASSTLTNAQKAAIVARIRQVLALRSITV